MFYFSNFGHCQVCHKVIVDLYFIQQSVCVFLNKISRYWSERLLKCDKDATQHVTSMVQMEPTVARWRNFDNFLVVIGYSDQTV